VNDPTTKAKVRLLIRSYMSLPFGIPHTFMQLRIIYLQAPGR